MRVPRIPVVSCVIALSALALACSDPSGPELPGTIEVVVLPTGPDVITTALQVRVATGAAHRLDSGRFSVTIPGLQPGTYSLQLEGVSENCQVTSTNPRQVAVASNQTTVVTFTMTCTRRVGNLRVVTVTTGADLDPDGYVATVDGTTYPLAVNGSAMVAAVGEGSRTVTLNGVVPNCMVTDGPTRTVYVPFGATAEVQFNIGCVAFGTLEVTIATTGADADLDGYSVRLLAPSISYSQEKSAGPNGSLTFERLRPADDYHLSLSGVNANCAVTGGSLHGVSVNPGMTTRATFAVTCESIRLLAVMLAGDIYSIRSNGSALTRLTTDDSWDGEPAWSSTGKIAFATRRHAQDPEIYVMNEDGSGHTRITTSAGDDDSPSWSPDGQRIVFRSFRDVNSEIYVVNADGTGVTRLTNSTADDRQPAWSSTGQIAFVSDRDHPSGEVYVMNPDGSNVVRITHNDSVEARPAWSPDGSMIAFSREVDCDYSCGYDLYVMNADGTGVRRLSTGWRNYQQNTDPAWSPNGHSIAFTRLDCDGYYYYYCNAPSVWVIDLRGGEPVQLMTEVFDPAWKP